METVIAFQRPLRPVGAGVGQPEGHLGRAAEPGLVEVPDMAARIVLEPVAQPQAQHVLARLQRQLVGIVIDDIVGIADVGGQRPFGDPPPVEVQLVKAERADEQTALARLLDLKSPAQIRGGNRRLMRPRHAGGTNKLHRKLHRILSLSPYHCRLENDPLHSSTAGEKRK